MPTPDDEMSDEELAEWLEVETHRLRGVPYPNADEDLNTAASSSTGFWENPFDDEDWNGK